MALTIDLSPEAESALQAQAAREGQTVVEFAVAVLVERAGADRFKGTSPSGKPKRQPLFGKYAHLSGSVDEFLREKHLENERDQRRADDSQVDRA